MPRRPDLPCAICGKLMWRGPTSRPAGEAVCQPCRRQQHGTKARYKAGCRCDPCRDAQAEHQREFMASFRERRGHSYSSERAGGGRHFIGRKDRLAIYERDAWTCQLCHDPVDPTLDPNDRMSATLDHIEPQSLALIPDHSPENLRLAHRSCNSRRWINAA